MLHLDYVNREWRYDSALKEIIIFGGVHIPICSERRPRQLARPMIRRAEDCWQVAPCDYRDGFFKPIPDAQFLVLCRAPFLICEVMCLIL